MGRHIWQSHGVSGLWMEHTHPSSYDVLKSGDKCKHMSKLQSEVSTCQLYYTNCPESLALTDLNKHKSIQESKRAAQNISLLMDHPLCQDYRSQLAQLLNG